MPTHEQQKVIETLKDFLSQLKSGKEKLPSGFGFKKIDGDKYELRVGIKKRVLMKAEGDTLVCHLIGDHESIRRFLRDYRNK